MTDGCERLAPLFLSPQGDVFYSDTSSSEASGIVFGSRDVLLGRRTQIITAMQAHRTKRPIAVAKRATDGKHLRAKLEKPACPRRGVAACARLEWARRQLSWSYAEHPECRLCFAVGGVVSAAPHAAESDIVLRHSILLRLVGAGVAASGVVRG